MSFVPDETNVCDNNSSNKSEDKSQVMCPMRAYVLKDNPIDNTSDSESDFEGYEDCTTSNDDFTLPEYLYLFFNRQQPQKRQRTGKYTGEVVVES